VIVAPTIKWQRWDSSTYNWFGTGASDTLPSIEAELDAWIAAVNANPSNVGRQVTKEKGYADSTSGTYAGFVISCGANGNTEKGYMGYYSSAASTKRFYFGDTFTDNGTNGGYGSITGGGGDSNVSWLTSGQEANFLLVYGTVDGQEYFSFGPNLGSTNSTAYQDGFLIAKATDGEWFMTTGDANAYMIHYWGAVSGWSNCNRNTGTVTVKEQESYFGARYSMVKNSATSGSSAGGAADTEEYHVYAAAPELLERQASSSYLSTGTRRVFNELGTGDNVYMLTSYYYGPAILVDLRT